MLRGILTAVGLHNHRTPAQRTVVCFSPLHCDHATNAEDVPAPQAYRFKGYIETDWAQVIVELWHNRKKVFRNLEAHCFR